VASDVIDQPVDFSEVTCRTGKRVKLGVADDYVLVVGTDGSLLRALVVEPARDDQPRRHSSTLT